MFRRYATRVTRLRLDRTKGLHGQIFATLEDGREVYLCSKEKWDLGRRDSLRSGWAGDERTFTSPKVVYTDAPLT
jgi:hypothetical protein